MLAFKVPILIKVFLVWSWNLLCMLEMLFFSFIWQTSSGIPIFCDIFIFPLYFFFHVLPSGFTMLTKNLLFWDSALRYDVIVICLYSMSQKWCMWKCAILINYNSVLSTVFSKIIKITKLDLKYRLFHQICICHSWDMFD